MDTNALEPRDWPLDVLYRHIPCGIVVEREGEGLIYTNPAAELLLDSERPDALVEKLSVEDHACQSRTLTVQRGADAAEPVEMSIVLPRLDGQSARVLVHAVPLNREQGVRETLYTLSDMTDLASARLELESVRNDLHTAEQRLQQHVQRQRTRDELTGLPNRAQLTETLAALLTTSHEPIAVMVLAINRFKDVNFTFGHDSGDAVIRQVSQRLLGRVDVVGRLNGNEFGLLVVGSPNDCAPQTTTARILKAFDLPFTVLGQELQVSATVGFVLSSNEEADAPTLLRKAHIALQLAKSKRESWFLYSAEYDEKSTNRTLLIGRLQRALDHGELALHYQPQIDLAHDQVVSTEALVRWYDPQVGIIPPDEFIWVAEESGLIRPVTQAILEMAIKQSRQWHDDGLDLSVSVNVSMRDLQDSQLPNRIVALLDRWKVEPNWITLEATESSSMRAFTQTLETIGKLDEIGLAFSIDDFGTGYSSLSYLKQLPASELKVDQSFVKHMLTDISDATIVRTTISMAHNLGMEVVAEGVEDVATLQQLRLLGCDVAQGYYIARPMPADDLRNWMRQADWKDPPVWKPKA